MLDLELSNRLHDDFIDGWRFLPEEAANFSVPPPALSDLRVWLVDVLHVDYDRGFFLEFCRVRWLWERSAQGFG
jgi:hypothetical protein